MATHQSDAPFVVVIVGDGMPAVIAMGRNRGGQLGSVVATKSGHWQGHWFEYRVRDGAERRIHRTKLLGKVREIHKSQAEALLRAHIESVGYEGEQARPTPTQQQYTFKSYCEERYLPVKRARWRAKSRALYNYLFEQYLIPKWRDTPLDRMDRVAVQAWLVELAETKSASFVEKCLMYTRAVLEDAVDEDLLGRNPCRRLVVPAAVRAEDKTYRTIDEIVAILRELPTERDKLILRLFVLSGLRPHELFALRWNDISGQRLLIDETLEFWTVVQATKTRRSRGLISLPTVLADELADFRSRSEYSLDRDFIFSTSNRTPLDPANWRSRVLQPAAKRAGIENADLRQLRRTFATLAPGAGMTLKEISEQLRHSTIATTADIYMQPVDGAGIAALDTLDFAINKRLLLRHDREEPGSSGTRPQGWRGPRKEGVCSDGPREAGGHTQGRARSSA